MNKTLTILMTMILLCINVLNVSAGSRYENVEDMPEFEKHIVRLVESKYSPSYSFDDGCYFNQVYSCYSNEASDEETVVKYIMFMLHTEPYIQPLSGARYIGEYVVYHGNYYSPYVLGYFVYVPKRDEVYNLQDAYYADIDGIEKAITEGCYLSALRGDVNVDGTLNIKDVTFIQKQLAGLLPSYPRDTIDKLGNGNSYFYDYVKDFNQDREINIKDATAIQKILVGLAQD